MHLRNPAIARLRNDPDVANATPDLTNNSSTGAAVVLQGGVENFPSGIKVLPTKSSLLSDFTLPNQVNFTSDAQGLVASAAGTYLVMLNAFFSLTSGGSNRYVYVQLYLFAAGGATKALHQFAQKVPDGIYNGTISACIIADLAINERVAIAGVGLGYTGSITWDDTDDYSSLSIIKLA